MNTMRPRLLIIIVTTAALSQCALKNTAPAAASEIQAVGSPTPKDDPDLVVRLADIDTVDVAPPQGKPLTTKITIKGLLHDGATQIHKIEQQKFADGVSVTVTTARPKNSLARVALIPFERTLTVNLADLPKGDCFITVNNYRAAIRIP